jgi:hypothetical protein
MNNPLFDLLMQRQMGQAQPQGNPMQGMMPPKPAMPPTLAQGIWSGAPQNTSGQPAPGGMPPPPSPNMTNKSTPPPMPNLPKVGP